MMEAPASHEEEFNDWYDHEHFPQRRALPGFLSASRWVCLDGWPRWLALYDLDSMEALRSDAYLAVSGANSTPWSKRILPRTIGRSRIVAQAASASCDTPLAPTGVSRLLLMRHTAVVPGLAAAQALQEQLSAQLNAMPQLLQTRMFHETHAQRTDVWSISLFGSPVFAQELAAAVGQAGGVGASVFNLYSPYKRA